MTTTNEFLLEFRTITGYSEGELTNPEVKAVKGRAEKHIRAQKSGLDEDFDLLSDAQGEEALFWYTCLFAKVAAGELDSQAVQVGAIDANTLLAKADDDVTEWYRNARKAVRNFRAGNRFQITSPGRDGREYPSKHARGHEPDTGGGDIGSDL